MHALQISGPGGESVCLFMPLLLREPEKIGKKFEKYDISGEQ